MADFNLVVAHAATKITNQPKQSLSYLDPRRIVCLASTGTDPDILRGEWPATLAILEHGGWLTSKGIPYPIVMVSCAKEQVGWLATYSLHSNLP